MQRRKFIKKAAIATAGLVFVGKQNVFGLESLPNLMDEEGIREQHKLTILHTNDVHSRLDPFPMDGGKYEGQGGILARKLIIDEIRLKNQNVLLLDAGDIFQGTPYFNLYKGEPEMKAMSLLGYDACTMGNHDFDGGIQNFANQLQHANFNVVVCNYDFSYTPLHNLVKPYRIIKRGQIKIGVIGVGIELNGLVPNALYGNTVYLDPISNANYYADYLKNKRHCDMIICLSHLGFSYTSDKISDLVLAQNSRNIDLILGGHTHTFLEAPCKVKNADGIEILVNQVGWGGVCLGSLQFDFIHKKGTNKPRYSHTVLNVK
jgi:5'-nucleotidase